MTQQQQQHYDVIIVGGGASGVYASHVLYHQLNHKNHMILEANSELGGRLKQSLNQNRPVTEIGAEFIHGDDSLLNKLLKQLNIPYEFAFDLTELKDPVKNGSLFYVNNELLDCRHPLVSKLNQTLEDLEEYDGSSGDVSVQGYLNRVFPSDSAENAQMSSLVDCYMVKTDGSNLDLMSVNGINEEESTLSNNNYHFSSGYSYRHLMNHLKKHLSFGRNYLTYTSVYKVQWHSDRNLFLINDGAFTANHVIVTVPLKQLQLNTIQFSPELPQEKQVIIRDYFSMETGMKVIARFKKPFWKKNTIVPHKLVFVPDHPIIAQFWFSNLINNDKINGSEYVVTGFSTASRTDSVSQNQLSNQQVIDSFVELLYKVYGVSPKDNLFIDGVVYDWRRDNLFVGGAYSCPKVKPQGTPIIKNPRAVLGQPIEFKHGHKLIFAGEATHPTQCSTVQGALESGEIAVNYLKKDLNTTTTTHSRL